MKWSACAQKIVHPCNWSIASESPSFIAYTLPVRPATMRCAAPRESAFSLFFLPLLSTPSDRKCRLKRKRALSPSWHSWHANNRMFLVVCVMARFPSSGACPAQSDWSGARHNTKLFFFSILSAVSYSTFLGLRSLEICDCTDSRRERKRNARQ